MNQPTVCIENQHSDILNMVVTEMVDQNYPLKAIDSYVSQIESFLNTMSSSIDSRDLKYYLKEIDTTTTVQALHFFFKEVLTKQNSLCRPQTFF